jgi:uncharacterized protein YndB with AHSA1/START domain
MWKEVLDFDLHARSTPTSVKALTAGKVFGRPTGGMVAVTNVGMDDNWFANHMSQANLDNPVEIIICRTFAAPRELVWLAWTDPNHVGRWWGPAGFTTTTHSMDFRPGGSWRYTMHGPDGVDYPNKTKYYEVEECAKLVYDHGGSDDRHPRRLHLGSHGRGADEGRPDRDRAGDCSGADPVAARPASLEGQASLAAQSILRPAHTTRPMHTISAISQSGQSG